MTLRRGFKAEANWYAVALRKELGLRAYDPLSPWHLAEHLAIRIVPLSDMCRFAPTAVRVLLTDVRDDFSAVTIFVGNSGVSRLICHNDGNAKTRQAADIAHELSHALLGHRPKQLFSDDPTAEAEANWMGPTLLVSDEAAYQFALTGQSVEVAAKAFSVSAALMRMRLQVSGALVRAQRARRGRRSA